MHNLIPDFILNNYKNNILKGEMDAFTMFIDVSGFTSLTENLMRGGSEGAEVLSNILKNIFKSNINHVYEYGGFISTFAGDATPFSTAFTNMLIIFLEVSSDITCLISCGSVVVTSPS